MEIADIKNRLSGFIKNAAGKFKETLTLPYAKTYILASILLTLLFIILFFPYGILLRNQFQKLDKKYVSSIYVGSIDVSLIDVTYIESVHTVLKNRDELSMENITLNPSINPYTLFIKNNIKTDLEISRFNYKTTKADVNLKVNGNINFIMDPDYSMINEGSIKLIMQNTILKIPEVKIPSPMGEFPLELPDIKIASINFESMIQNRTLKIEKLVVSGTDLRGKISGSVKLANIISNSTLDLIITIDPDSKILASYKEMLTGFLDKKGKLSIPLKGTIAHPRADMKRSGGDKTLQEKPKVPPERMQKLEGRIPGLKRRR